MGSPSPDVEVLCVTWNSAAHIGGFLRSLGPALEGVDRWHLSIIDNASTDGTITEVRRLAPEATIVPTGFNAGYAAAVNAGLDRARTSRAVLVFNPDVRLDPGSAAALFRGLQQPGVGITVPRQRGRNGELLWTLRRSPTVRRALGEAVLGGLRAGRYQAWGEIVLSPEAYTRTTVADWATGSAMAISRECLDAVGPWDDRYFLYSEEVDFALRARDHGYALQLVPQATCEHATGDSHESSQLWALLVTNRWRHFAVRHGVVHAGLFRLALLVGELLRATSGSQLHRAAVVSLLGGEKAALRLIGELSRGR